MNKSIKAALIAVIFSLSFLVIPKAYADVSLNASTNWSGYAVEQGTYTGVSGTFVMPELSYSTTLASNATWVGIGGRGSADLIQAGVYEIANSDGATYQAWYELLPEDSTPVNLAVHPKDSISVAIIETSADIWNIVITNNTTKQQFAKTVQYHSLHSSAEWIQERAQVNGVLAPLSGFTPVPFTGATAVQNGQRLAISQMNPQMINLLDTGNTTVALAVPSAINADGTSFSVFRTSAVATAVPAASTIQTIPFSQIPPYLLRRTGHDIFPLIPGSSWILRYFPQ
ncbi:MAG: G1 family glutamic endopeptidase [Candidatus Paceibacterota bacterium]